MSGALWKSRLLAAALAWSGASVGAAEWDNVSWHNVAEITPAGGDHFRFSRVPARLRTQLNAAAQTRSFSPAGVELRFNLNGPEARIRMRYVEDRAPRTRGAPVLVEIWQGDFLARTVTLTTTWSDYVISRSGNADLQKAAGERSPGRYAAQLVRVAFPHGTEIQVQSLQGDVSPPTAGQTPSRRYLAYGSSITQGYDATRAGEPYPAQVGRLLGVDVINLGFGAGAHLEPAMADWIAQRQDWDFATLELGVNLVSRVPTEEFRRRVRYFLTTIASAHPEKWIFVIDLFPSFRDLQSTPRVAEYRRVIEEEVGRLQSPAVRHVSAETLLSDYGLLGSDLLHPAPDGFAEIARKLAQIPALRSAAGKTPLSGESPKGTIAPRAQP